jgi:hypothetical protein
MTPSQARRALWFGVVTSIACSERSPIQPLDRETTCASLAALPDATTPPPEVSDVVWLALVPGARDPWVVNWGASRINGRSGRRVDAHGTSWLVAGPSALSLRESSAARTAGVWLDCESGNVEDYVARPLAPRLAEPTGGLREVSRYPERENEWPYERTSDLTLVGRDLIAVARGPDGLRILRRDEQGRVLPLSHLAAVLGDDYNDVTAVGERHVAVASKRRGLLIVDLADPSRPAIVAEELPWISPRDVHSVFVEGERVFVAQAPAAGTGAVTAFDVTVRSAPRQFWRWTADAGHDAHDVAVRGNRAYVSSIRGGITVLEWQTGGEPTVAARYPGLGAHSGTHVGGADPEFWLWGEERVGGRLHWLEIASGDRGVYLEGTPLPSQFRVGGPRTEGAWFTSIASPHQAECREQVCFLAHYQLGVRVLPIVSSEGAMRPAQRPVASYPTWQPSVSGESGWLRGATGVALDLPWVYVADSENGLMVLHYTPKSTAPESTD